MQATFQVKVLRIKSLFPTPASAIPIPLEALLFNRIQLKLPAGYVSRSPLSTLFLFNGYKIPAQRRKNINQAGPAFGGTYWH